MGVEMNENNVCFPLRRACSKTNIWEVVGVVGEKSSIGDIYQVCCQQDCDYILKTQGRADYDREIKFYNMIYKVYPALVPKILDHFDCGYDGGAIFMEKMDLTLGRAIILLNNLDIDSTVKLQAKITIVEHLSVMIGLIHQLGIIHHDAHVNNFMCRYNEDRIRQITSASDSRDVADIFTDWKIIDFGKSKLISEFPCQKAVYFAEQDYSYIRALLS